MKMIWRTLRHKTLVWQWFAAALLTVCVAAAPAQASVQEMRVVGVGVNSSSFESEKLAMDYARKRAVYLAARKLGAKDLEKQLKKWDEATYKEVIRGATVTNTRREGETTYLEVQVTIVEDALRRALKLPGHNGETTADFDMRGVMLMTLYIGKERSYLWEKENVMRGPVSEEVRRQSRGSILLPSGDLQDLRLIDYQNALTVEPKELEPMFERYGADEIIIAATKLSEPGTTDATNIILRRLEPTRSRSEVIEIAPESPEEPADTRLQKAATAIASAATEIASSTAEREREMREKAQKIKVRFSYTVPKDLAKMQEVLEASPDVLHVDMPSIALARVAGTIYLKGSEESLREYLIKQGIIVTAINDGWRLSTR